MSRKKIRVSPSLSTERASKNGPVKTVRRAVGDDTNRVVEYWATEEELVAAANLHVVYDEDTPPPPDTRYAIAIVREGYASVIRWVCNELDIVAFAKTTPTEGLVAINVGTGAVIPLADAARGAETLFGG